MRIQKLILGLAVCTVYLTACQKEYFIKETVDPNIPISFSKDLQPIMTPKCASSGCHDKNIPPNLLEGKAYDDLWDGGYIDTLKPDESILMIKLNTNMPPTLLPSGQIDKFRVWMKQGAKNN